MRGLGAGGGSAAAFFAASARIFAVSLARRSMAAGDMSSGMRGMEFSGWADPIPRPARGPSHVPAKTELAARQDLYSLTSSWIKELE